MQGCAISPDGTLVATGGGDKALNITNIAKKATVFTSQSDAYVRALFSFPVLTSF